MARYKIGITEAGDAGLDLSWANKLDTVDGAIIITKCISPEFYDAVLSITPELEHRKSGYVERKRRPYQGNVVRIA